MHLYIIDIPYLLLPEDKWLTSKFFALIFHVKDFQSKKDFGHFFLKNTKITEQVVMKNREERKRTDRTRTDENILNATSSSSFLRKKGTGCYLSRPSASFCSLLELTGRTREGRDTSPEDWFSRNREREKEARDTKEEKISGGKKIELTAPRILRKKNERTRRR